MKYSRCRAWFYGDHGLPRVRECPSQSMMMCLENESESSGYSDPERPELAIEVVGTPEAATGAPRLTLGGARGLFRRLFVEHRLSERLRGAQASSR